MKKENLFLLVNAVIMALIGLLFVVFYSQVIPNEPKDYLFGQSVQLKDTEVIEAIPSDTSYAIIHEKSIAYSASNEELGTVYNIKFKNSFGYDENGAGLGYGEFLVGISTEDLVSVEVVELVQSSWTIRGIQQAIYDAFQDIPYLEVKDIPNINVADLDAGTTASASTSTIRSLVTRVVNVHYEISEGPADPFETAYGVGYGRNLDNSFAAVGRVLSRDIVTDYDGVLVGYVYQLTGSTLYNEEENETGDITVYVGVDLTNDIVVIDLPLSEYHHSTGDFYYGGVVTFANMLLGLNLNEVETQGPDLITGPSNSKNLVIDLIVDLKEVVLG